jgi:diguanylate cyclase (GGDEF)-like protein
MAVAPKINLRNLIVLFTLISVSVTLLNSLLVAFQVYRGALIRTTLAANEAYALKIASSVGQTLEADIKKTGYSARVAGMDPGMLRAEMQRLLTQDNDFTSIIAANNEGDIIATLPERHALYGKRLKVWEPALIQTPRVSSAFVSLSGNLVVFISHPVIDKQGNAVGLIGGTIHLTADNALSGIISHHGFRNGTHVQLVDGSGTYLFHSDATQLGQSIRDPALLEVAQRGESGSLSVREDTGSETLTGFAPVPGTSWRVLVQQPLEIADNTVNELIWTMAWQTLPLDILGLLLIVWGAARISRPLRQLAESAQGLSEHGTTGTLRAVNAWYVEAWRIKRALLVGIELVEQRLGTLNEQAHSDALTGLANRRVIDQSLRALTEQGMPFALIAADIDHFKHVNDTFGHDIGDNVLKRLAQVLISHSRSNDVICRSGGEEFLIILPGANLPAAAAIAERIRRAVQDHDFEEAGKITLSLGVTASSQPLKHSDAVNVLKTADELLYAAKQMGRNRVEAGFGHGAVTVQGV